MTRRDRSRCPSHEGMLGSISLAGFLARVSSVGERLPTSFWLAVAALLFDVDPYSGGAAPDLHRVPFCNSTARNKKSQSTKRVMCGHKYIDAGGVVKPLSGFRS